MALPSIPVAPIQSEFGFTVSHQVIPMPGRSDLYTVRVSTTPRTGEDVLSASDVADRLRMSTRTVRRLMESGAIASHRPGKRLRRVYWRDLAAYCRSVGIAC